MQTYFRVRKDKKVAVILIMAGTTDGVGVGFDSVGGDVGSGDGLVGNIGENEDGLVNDGGFCEGKFWDLSLTWETEDPDFTPCFHQTVTNIFNTMCLNEQGKCRNDNDFDFDLYVQALTYAPLAVLLLLLPVQVFR